MLKRREIILKEIKKLLSREVMIYFVIVPILAVLVFGFLYIKRIGREYPIVVVDQEKNAVSRLAVLYLESSPEIHVVKILNNVEDGYNEMRNGNAQAIVILQRNLYKNVIRKESEPAIVIVDTRNLIEANSLLTGIAKTLGTARIGSELKLMDKYFPVPDRRNKVLPFTVVSRPMGNPSLDYFLFVISAILVLATQQGILVGSCIGIAKERENNTLNDTIESAGGAFRYVLFRHFSVMVFAIPIVLVVSLIFYGAFSIPSENLFASIVMLVLFAGTVVTFSNFVGLFFKRPVNVLQFFFFFTLPVFFMSGYTYPLESIHPVLRFIVRLMPTTPILNSFPRINYIEGSVGYLGSYFLHQFGLYLMYMVLGIIGTILLNKKISKSQ